MGVAAAGAAVGGGLSILSAAYQIDAARQEGHAKVRALELRRLQERVASQTTGVQILRGANQLLSHQLAVQSTKGVSLGSPSFQAIESDTLNEFKKDEDAERLNLLSKETAISNAERQAEFEAKMKKRKILFDTASSLANTAVAAGGGSLLGASGSGGVSVLGR